ncbi:Permease, cytosine/purine, uracil, thiamine, allantoin family [Escherichia coli]|nr:Permease, cytosine/purine, uracil, thiamine, allantoin family [Escherichia coli]
MTISFNTIPSNTLVPLFYAEMGNDSNLLIVFYVQIMPDDFVMQLHRF